MVHRTATHFICLIPGVACSRAVRITPELGPRDAHRARMLTGWAASKSTKFEIMHRDFFTALTGVQCATIAPGLSVPPPTMRFTLPGIKDAALAKVLTGSAAGIRRLSAPQVPQFTFLVHAGVQCASYHAGMKDAARAKVLTDWAAGRVRCVAATVAFGMGIDRAAVRLVVHYNLPKTLEGFYQVSIAPDSSRRCLRWARACPLHAAAEHLDFIGKISSL